MYSASTLWKQTLRQLVSVAFCWDQSITTRLDWDCVDSSYDSKEILSSFVSAATQDGSPINCSTLFILDELSSKYFQSVAEDKNVCGELPQTVVPRMSPLGVAQWKIEFAARSGELPQTVV